MRLDPAWLDAQPPRTARLLRAIDAGLAADDPARIGVAVSGGGDSVALLVLLAKWCAATDVPLLAVTLDHGLRAEARDEVDLARRHCEALGVRHTTLSWKGWDGTGNLQAAARAARYRLIGDWARAEGVGVVALGHTSNDVAETFLMRLARQAGVEGLAAMAPAFVRHDCRWVRPLWQVPRTELRDFLSDAGIDWAEDASNEDPQFDRVKARQVLAALEPLGITVEGLTHSAFALGLANSALAQVSAAVMAARVTEDRGDLLIDLGTSPAVPQEIRRRLLNRALQWVASAPYPPRWSALAGMEARLGRDGDQQTLAGCLIRQEGPHLRIAREEQAVTDRVLRYEPGAIWDNRWRLNGPLAPGLEIRALGSGLNMCADWRATGLPRSSLRASPALWDGATLIAAPLADFGTKWAAQIVTPFTPLSNSH